MESYRDKIVGYFDQVAPLYGVKHGADMPGGKYSFGQLYRKVLAPYFKPGMDVLELGCGNGASSEMLSDFGVKLVAADISQGMIDVASSRGLKNTRFRQMDGMKIDEAKDLGIFDAVVSFNCFSYFPDKAKVLRDIKRVIRPGGSLIILDMNPLCPVYPLAALFGINEMKEWWSTIREMSPGKLRSMFTRQGYRVEVVRTLNFVPHATSGVIFHALKAVNPILNFAPGLNRLAMRVLIVAKTG